MFAVVVVVVLVVLVVVVVVVVDVEIRSCLVLTFTASPTKECFCCPARVGSTQQG